MNISQDSQDSLLLLAHFHKNLTSDKNVEGDSLNLKIINDLLDKGLNINQKFRDNFLLSSGSTVSGVTPLYFVYARKFSIEIFNTLIERGADFTVKNADGQSILHPMMEGWRDSKKSEFEIFMNSVLSAHVKFQNISNPSDGNGLTHFHCACMTNHTQAIEFFLENGVSINRAVNANSTLFPGYTGLHLASKFFALEATKMLLDSKANAFAENEQGLTPLQAFIKNEHEAIEELKEYGALEESSNYLGQYDKIISLFLERDHSLTTSFFHFYAACTLQDTRWVEKILEHVPDINQSISMSASNWPGYTPLHFAAYCSLDVMKLLIEKGANIVAEDVRGMTPLNICFRYHSLKDVCSLLSKDLIWANTLLSDGKTKLLDLMRNMNSASSFRPFLNSLEDVNSIVPVDSPFWPGYTCLHVAIVISKSCNDEILKMCLNYGSDVNIRNARGQTPIHLAFRLEKNYPPLLEHLESLHDVVDVLDEDNLSYLHIADSKNLIERLLPTSNVNVTYKGSQLDTWYEKDWPYGVRAVTGWTPLHFAVRYSGNAVIELLIGAGAVADAKDVYGLTPAHWAAHASERSNVDGLFARDDLKDCITEFGMSYLHVACAIDNTAAVERLIRLGSKVDAVMRDADYSLGQPSARYCGLPGFTPLELALDMRSYKALVSLVKNGAKMSIDDFQCTKILNKEYHHFDALCQAAWKDSELGDILEKELGLSRLHVACYCAEVRFVEKLLDQGTSVDARVHAKSKVFAGCTPLHFMIMEADRQSPFEKVQLLLERGADVTLTNVEGNTPVQLSLELVEKWSIEEAEKCTSLLIANQRDFSLNPVNADGISHFHVACLAHNVEAVEGFLLQGVDVNQPTDLFCEKYARYSPLHFAFEYPSIKFARNQSPLYVVDLLLKNGANVQAQDARGNTPLHEACRDARTDIGLLAYLISFGADVSTENVRGETPFELLLSSSDVLPEQIRLFIKHGARFSDSNRLSDRGYIGTFIFVNFTQPEKTIFNKVTNFSSDITRDERGRTPIHNTVAISKADSKSNLESQYYEIINWFIKKGIDIDDQDDSGKTALHYAAQFGNTHALYALLQLGADINIIDKSGRPAFSYTLERGKEIDNEIAASEIFYLQVRIREMIGLEVSQLNRDLYNELDVAGISTVIARIHDRVDNYGPAIERWKCSSVGKTSLTLHDFLVDTEAVVNYAFMPKKTRDQIDKFFLSLSKVHFYKATNIFIILKSQYSKAVARVSLIDDAARSLRAHLGFSFPGLCEDITMYLSNAELKNLIKSAD